MVVLFDYTPSVKGSPIGPSIHRHGKQILPTWESWCKPGLLPSLSVVLESHDVTAIRIFALPPLVMLRLSGYAKTELRRLGYRDRTPAHGF